ncbi:hypothetical protein D3C76_1182600 [compost metagenome]
MHCRGYVGDGGKLRIVTLLPLQITGLSQRRARAVRCHQQFSTDTPTIIQHYLGLLRRAHHIDHSGRTMQRDAGCLGQQRKQPLPGVVQFNHLP